MKERVLRCKAAVYKRDTYRYTGRTKGGFELHYKTKQCSRPATNGGRCWQHQNPNLLEAAYREFITEKGQQP